MLKKILALLLLLVATFPSFSQVQPKEVDPTLEPKEVQSRTLLVMLMAEDPKKVAKLAGKPEDLATYRAEIEQFNVNLKWVFEKFWKFSTKVDFKPVPEATKMSKGKAGKGYCLFNYRVEKVGAPAPPSKEIALQPPYTKLSKPDEYGYFDIRLPEKMLPTQAPVAKVKLPFYAPNLDDMVFGVTLLQRELQHKLDNIDPKAEYKQLDFAAQALKTNTLLINKFEIEEDLIDERTFKRAYPYDYEINHPDSISNHILDQDPGFSYVKIIPEGIDQLRHYVINCEDGTVQAIVTTRYDPKKTRRQRITTAELKQYCALVKR